ncbi:MAG: NAD(P)H-hydrate dehydratase [Pegethrix bostrychoides GSE-TBD4-15B]|jgi:NAD(P)H-hydrate epimerase|uniref:Bifunctional NAD(P)H-hydrate repair enzyme n=1 Tax=Pegethrix bostrychoides GSE-TBD4-15B TaxID=2839662 RepID=A0A951P6X6_9CYAN|nr:NAD(P)H-hydrate dehydratase [Pegethrix bostrychoides GSE-TBD4-15B]
MPKRPVSRTEQLNSFVVTAQQMQQIEARIFAAGMPVAALMEKVGGLLSQWICVHYPQPIQVGLLVGSGHNGGDALVVARELHLAGYKVRRYQPFDHFKELTQAHAQYADHLEIPVAHQINDLQDCDLIIDGLFGFGLSRPITGDLAAAIEQLNAGSKPVISIDLPSGIQTDTGAVLGTAVCASHTLCLGLWKRAFLQDAAADYIGKAELLDFGLPLSDIQAVLNEPCLQRITLQLALSGLPLPRSATTHKYRQGHLLLVCGSRQYMGAAILSGLAARASGVGMLSIAVPEALRPLLIAQLPDALILGCPETPTGAIADLPPELDLASYQAIACGPGLTLEAMPVVQKLLESDRLLLLDADGLNALAKLGIDLLKSRPASTVLTPHLGEFKRLFPELQLPDRMELAQAAARQGAILLLKGAKTVIANPAGQIWLNPDSTPALARGGSGDVLTGLMGGLLAQAAAQGISPEQAAVSAAWWHAQAGILAAQQRTELGVDASTLVQFLIPALAHALGSEESPAEVSQQSEVPSQVQHLS